MLMNKIAVIITNYRHHAYLMDAVQSILNQTFEDFELLILNDDTNTDLLNYFDLDERVYVFPTEERMGQPAQLNRGINIAYRDGCKYIAFQDADDWSFPYRLELSYHYAEQEKLDLVYGDRILWYPDRQVYWNSPAWDRYKLHKRPMGCWGSYFVRTDLAKKMMFDENISYWNDHIWEAKIAVTTTRVSKICLPLYKQRTNTSQFRTCKIPVYRKLKRLCAVRKINKQVREITGA